MGKWITMCGGARGGGGMKEGGYEVTEEQGSKQ